MIKDVVKRAAEAVVALVQPMPARRPRDPWYTDDQRKAEVNAASSRGPQRWMGRRGGWLR